MSPVPAKCVQSKTKLPVMWAVKSPFSPRKPITSVVPAIRLSRKSSTRTEPRSADGTSRSVGIDSEPYSRLLHGINNPVESLNRKLPALRAGLCLGWAHSGWYCLIPFELICRRLSRNQIKHKSIVLEEYDKRQRGKNCSTEQSWRPL